MSQSRDGLRHNLSDCSKFKALSVEERLSEVQKHKLCFRCLQSGHWLNDCPKWKQCGVNGIVHDLTMHYCTL